MNKTAATTGAVIVGSSGLTPQVQECVGDVFAWCHIAPAHPASWAILLMATLGVILHSWKGKPDAPQNAPVAGPAGP